MWQERGPSPSARSAAAAEVAEVIDGQPLVPGLARRGIAKSMPHHSLPPLLAREEFKCVLYQSLFNFAKDCSCKSNGTDSCCLCVTSSEDILLAAAPPNGPLHQCSSTCDCPFIETFGGDLMK